MRLRLATHTANTAAAATTRDGQVDAAIRHIGNTRDVLSVTHIGLRWVGAAREASTPPERDGP